MRRARQGGSACADEAGTSLRSPGRRRGGRCSLRSGTRRASCCCSSRGRQARPPCRRCRSATSGAGSRATCSCRCRCSPSRSPRSGARSRARSAAGAEHVSAWWGSRRTRRQVRRQVRRHHAPRRGGAGVRRWAWVEAGGRSKYLQCEGDRVGRLGVRDDVGDVDGDDPLAERVRPRRATPLPGDRVIVDFAPRLGEDHLPAAVVVELEERAGVRVLLPVERDVDLRAGGTGGGGGQRRGWASGRPLEGAGGAALPARLRSAEHHQRWASARGRSGRAAESRCWRPRRPAPRRPL